MKPYFDLDKNLIHERSLFSDNGTLITNFNCNRLDRYADSIVKSKLQNKLIISPFAYNSFGELLIGYCSLHSYEMLEMNEFWRIFRI